MLPFSRYILKKFIVLTHLSTSHRYEAELFMRQRIWSKHSPTFAHESRVHEVGRREEGWACCLYVFEKSCESVCQILKLSDNGLAWLGLF